MPDQIQYFDGTQFIIHCILLKNWAYMKCWGTILNVLLKLDAFFNRKGTRYFPLPLRILCCKIPFYFLPQRALGFTQRSQGLFSWRPLRILRLGSYIFSVLSWAPRRVDI